jgi:hypothetical protein
LQRIESRKAPKIDVADLMCAFTSASEGEGEVDDRAQVFELTHKHNETAVS